MVKWKLPRAQGAPGRARDAPWRFGSSQPPRAEGAPGRARYAPWRFQSSQGPPKALSRPSQGTPGARH
eukprot:8116992-Pyramimonas_sp.AAC.1